MAEGSVLFNFGDTLPTRYDTAIAIFDKSKKDGKFRETVVNVYVTALRRHWIKAFGENHVIHFKTSKSGI